MKLKDRIRIVLEILLVIAAAAAVIFNVSTQREIVYISSMIAFFAAITYLVRDIAAIKKQK